MKKIVSKILIMVLLFSLLIVFVPVQEVTAVSGLTDIEIRQMMDIIADYALVGALQNAASTGVLNGQSITSDDLDNLQEYIRILQQQLVQTVPPQIAGPVKIGLGAAGIAVDMAARYVQAAESIRAGMNPSVIRSNQMTQAARQNFENVFRDVFVDPAAMQNQAFSQFFETAANLEFDGSRWRNMVGTYTEGLGIVNNWLQNVFGSSAAQQGTQTLQHVTMVDYVNSLPVVSPIGESLVRLLPIRVSFRNYFNDNIVYFDTWIGQSAGGFFGENYALFQNGVRTGTVARSDMFRPVVFENMHWLAIGLQNVQTGAINLGATISVTNDDILLPSQQINNQTAEVGDIINTALGGGALSERIYVEVPVIPTDGSMTDEQIIYRIVQHFIQLGAQAPPIDTPGLPRNFEELMERTRRVRDALDEEARAGGINSGVVNTAFEAWQRLIEILEQLRAAGETLTGEQIIELHRELIRAETITRGLTGTGTWTEEVTREIVEEHTREVELIRERILNPNRPPPGRPPPGITFAMFPFCIPWDVFNIVNTLARPPIEPAFEAQPFAAMGFDWTFRLDFSLFEPVIIVFRWVMRVTFVIVLALITRRFIWTGGG